ncbi:hypothetical protein ACVWZR_003462 [Bradyrhizobium sp. i1.3.1]
MVPEARASATSSALAARIAAEFARIARSMAPSALFFCSGGASASTRAAARARAARSDISAWRSALPSTALRGAAMESSTFC